ncbi:hypothetical protein NFI96_020484 [Prochilodus magdalenae]|nr:hypothetical protein NFI96_020484 [Prochilodus magdalenae]
MWDIPSHGISTCSREDNLPVWVSVICKDGFIPRPVGKSFMSYTLPSLKEGSGHNNVTRCRIMDNTMEFPFKRCYSVPRSLPCFKGTVLLQVLLKQTLPRGVSLNLTDSKDNLRRVYTTLTEPVKFQSVGYSVQIQENDTQVWEAVLRNRSSSLLHRSTSPTLFRRDMAKFLCLVQFCLILALCSASSGFRCRWIDNKFRQYHGKSLTLLREMGSGISVDSRDANVFDANWVLHHTNSQPQKQVWLVIQTLEEISALLREADSVTWSEERLRDFLSMLDHETEGLRSCVSTLFLTEVCLSVWRRAAVFANPTRQTSRYGAVEVPNGVL